MNETIYTIPINEAFDACAADPSCGCPFCRLYNMLETNEIDIILGAAMMEPDIRKKTNEQERQELMELKEMSDKLHEQQAQLQFEIDTIRRRSRRRKGGDA